MNVFAQTQLLARLTSDIRDEVAKYAVTPPAQHTTERDQLIARIGRWQSTVKGFETSLKSRTHFNEMQYEAARFTQNSYSAGQRRNSNAANIARVRAHLTEAMIALNDLIRAIQPTFEQATMDLLGHLMEEVGKKSEASTSDDVFFHAPITGQLEATIQQQVQPYQPPNAPQGSGVFSIFYALCFLTMIALKARKS